MTELILNKKLLGQAFNYVALTGLELTEICPSLPPSAKIKGVCHQAYLALSFLSDAHTGSYYVTWFLII